MKPRTAGAILAVLGSLVVLAAASGQTLPRIGLVTTLVGEASVLRAGQAEPRPLRFKNDVFSGDTLRTGAGSVVRVLVRGTTLVAAAESSAVGLADDGGRAVVRIDRGKVSVIATRGAGRPDGGVEIRTPDAVVTLGGSSVVAEVADAESRTTLHVLSGSAVVRRAGPGLATPVSVAALGSVSASRGAVGPVQALAADTAALLLKDFRLGPQHTGATGETVREIGTRGQSDMEAEVRALQREGVKGLPPIDDPLSRSRAPVVPIQPTVPAQPAPRACC